MDIFPSLEVGAEEPQHAGEGGPGSVTDLLLPGEGLDGLPYR